MVEQRLINLRETMDNNPAVLVVAAGSEWLWVAAGTGELISRFDMLTCEYDEAYGIGKPKPKTWLSWFKTRAPEVFRILLEEALRS